MTTKAIFRLREFTPTTRIILATLSACADSTRRVVMRQADIAARAGTTTRFVRRALATLAQAGALVIERKGEKSTPQIVRLVP